MMSESKDNSRYLINRMHVFAVSRQESQDLKLVETRDGLRRFDAQVHNSDDIALVIPMFRVYYAKTDKGAPKSELISDKGVAGIEAGFNGESLCTFRKEQYESNTGDMVTRYKLFSVQAIAKEKSEMERMVELMSKAGITPVINIGTNGKQQQ